MNPGIVCTGVALDRGEVSHGSRGRELVIELIPVCTGVGRLKDNIGGS